MLTEIEILELALQQIREQMYKTDLKQAEFTNKYGYRCTSLDTTFTTLANRENYIIDKLTYARKRIVRRGSVMNDEN